MNCADSPKRSAKDQANSNALHEIKKEKRCQDLHSALLPRSLSAPEERAAFLQLNIRKGFELETMQLVRGCKGNKGSVM